MSGRANKPVTGNPLTDASSVTALYETDGKLSERDLRVSVEATRQLIAAPTATTRAMSRTESVCPAIREGLNEIHAVTTGRVGRRQRGRHCH